MSINLPLKDPSILASPHGVITVLWAIRNYGPLTFEKLFELIFSGGNQALEVNASATTGITIGNNTKLLAAALETLVDSGLLIVDGGDLTLLSEMTAKNIKAAIQARVAITLEVSPTLSSIQQLFSLSLNDFMQSGAGAIHITPSFGEPLEGTGGDVFVVMPFAPELRPIYEDHILHAVNALHLSCKRGDDFFSDNSIIMEVWSAIYHSKLCIAECTDRNPNVFYEIGIAHTLGRPCILIAQSVDDIPFDVRERRIIIYENSAAGLHKFRDVLTKTIQAELGMQSDRLQEIFNKLD